MIIIANQRATSDSGKYVHRKGSETDYGRSITLYTGETADNFEETDSVPEIYEVPEMPEWLREELAGEAPVSK